MKKSTITAVWALWSVTYISANLSASILAYEGFASDLTGSGQNYEQGVNLETISKNRTGFEGDWFNASNQSATHNVRSEAGNLSYSGYKSGDAGLAVPFNDSTVESTSTLARNFDLTDASVSGGYYLSLLIDYSGGEGGFTLAGASDTNSFTRNSANVTWDPAGGSATGGFTASAASLGISDSQPNLIVVQYTTDQSGPGSNYYSRWNLWINPDLSGGTLGSEDFSGEGIGLFDGSANVSAPASFGISNARINAGSSIQIDEVYLTTDSQDFIVIPEPGSILLLCIGFAGLCIASFRRR